MLSDEGYLKVSKDALDKLNTRLCSIANKRMVNIYEVSPAAHKILSEDLPSIIKELYRVVDCRDKEIKKQKRTIVDK